MKDQLTNEQNYEPEGRFADAMRVTRAKGLKRARQNLKSALEDLLVAKDTSPTDEERKAVFVAYRRVVEAVEWIDRELDANLPKQVGAQGDDENVVLLFDYDIDGQDAGLTYIPQVGDRVEVLADHRLINDRMRRSLPPDAYRPLLNGDYSYVLGHLATCVEIGREHNIGHVFIMDGGERVMLTRHFLKKGWRPVRA